MTTHPHQLRHNAATELRREFGLEPARIIPWGERRRTFMVSKVEPSPPWRESMPKMTSMALRRS
jgi:hypothetical protein